jgi:hypothetical protein
MYKNIIRGWLTGILVFIPFQHSIFRIINPSISELAAFINCLDEITVIAFLPFAIREYYKNREIRNPLYPILLFPVIAIIIAGFVSGMTNANSLFITAYGTFDYIKFFLVIFIFMAFFREYSQFQKIFRILLLVAVVIGSVALIQELWAAGNRYILGKDTFNSGVYLFRSPPQTEAQSRAIWRLGIYRPPSLLSHYNLLGLYSLLILTFYLHTARKVNFLILLPLFTGVFLSVSKIVYAGFLLITGLEIYKRRRWFIVFCVAAIILLFFIVPLSDLEGKHWAPGYGKMDYREYARLKAMEVWGDHPVLGVGPGMFGGAVAFKQHSPVYEEYDFLIILKVMHSLEQFWPQVLAELGIFGTVAFAGLFISLIAVSVMLRKQAEEEDLRGLFTGLMAFTIIFFLYTLSGNLNNAGFILPYLAFAGMGLGCSNKTGKLPIRLLGSFFILLVLIPLIFYIANPFNNRCVKGNCSTGKGSYIFHSGIMYEGEWKNGRRNGQGTWTNPLGYSYIGEWRNGKRHGRGIMTYPDGKKKTGKWEENRFTGR